MKIEEVEKLIEQALEDCERDIPRREGRIRFGAHMMKNRLMARLEIVGLAERIANGVAKAVLGNDED